MTKNRNPFSLIILFFTLIVLSIQPLAFSETYSAKVSLPDQIIVNNSPVSLSDINPKAFEMAMHGFKKVNAKGNYKNIIAIADFSKPSTTKRLYIFNTESGKLLYQTYVA